MKNINLSRRRLLTGLGAMGLATAFYEIPGVFAEALVTTPEQTEGPYYPPNLPLDTDNDLLVVNNNITPAVGTILYLSGTVFDSSGNPVRDAHLEIWHADNTGAYIHPASMGYSTRDQNFQGFGRFLTGSAGQYLFRTIKPGLYTGRTRHIHMKVKLPGRADLTTQVYFEEEPQNATDMVLRGIQDAQQRASVIIQLSSITGSSAGALGGTFDVVLGSTVNSAPSLSVLNMSSAASNSTFKAGDSWQLNLSGAPAGSRVYLHLWRNGQDVGVSGPYGSSTDNAGGWSVSGSFGSQDVGSWQVQAVIGTATSQLTSSRLFLTVS